MDGWRRQEPVIWPSWSCTGGERGQLLSVPQVTEGYAVQKYRISTPRQSVLDGSSPPRTAGGLGRSAITLDMGDVVALAPCSQEMASHCPGRNCTGRGVAAGQWCREVVARCGGASPEQDAAVGASEDGWGRRPGQLSGRHGGDVLFFVVV